MLHILGRGFVRQIGLRRQLHPNASLGRSPGLTGTATPIRRVNCGNRSLRPPHPGRIPATTRGTCLMGYCEIVETTPAHTLFEMGPGKNAGRWEVTLAPAWPTVEGAGLASKVEHPQTWLVRRIDPRDWPKEYEVASPEELDRMMDCGIVPFPTLPS